MRIALLSPSPAPVPEQEKPTGIASALTAEVASQRHGQAKPATAVTGTSGALRSHDPSTSHSNSSSLSQLSLSLSSTSARSHSQSPTERTSQLEEADTHLQVPVQGRQRSTSGSQIHRSSGLRPLHPSHHTTTASLHRNHTLSSPHQHVSVPSLLVDQPAITVSHHSACFFPPCSYPRKAAGLHPCI